MNQDKREEAKKALEEKAQYIIDLFQQRLLQEIDKRMLAVMSVEEIEYLEWFKELILTIKP